MSVWDLDTGEKTMQFSRCHGDMELTAMIFDPSGRRLITGGRDGSLKIWNFNNGACLNVLENRFTLEVGVETLILSFLHSVIPPFCHSSVLPFFHTQGDIFMFSEAADHCWGMEPTSLCIQVCPQLIPCTSSNPQSPYSDTRDPDSSIPKYFGAGEHREDILSIAGQEPNLLASASYDGDILLWNLDIEKCVGRLNASCQETRLPRPVFGCVLINLITVHLTYCTDCTCPNRLYMP